ncbi:sorting nexin-33 isoform X2 [Musca domestica]|uniref:Sorting nexin-33 isoform X2 n=1 Tax=Musca domestica TaxID=7370 RepID=A0A9J7IFB6_MUSDO|nr:sorting nexin-33 isoform X2 [Musca domestica]
MASYVRALYEFSGEPGTSEISISVGDVLQVTRTDVGEGWWEGKNKNTGSVGLFPAAYVEVMSAVEAKHHQQPHVSQSVSDSHHNTGRYDSTADDYNDGDDWEDDWDDDNDTYSEIGPSNSINSKITDKPFPHSGSNYDNRHLPATPNEDNSLPATLSGNNTSTLKKSSMFGKSSDSFILGLGNKDKLPDNELVKIVPNDTYYQWQTNEGHSYSVIVASPKKESKFKGMKTFIAYQLTPSFNNISVSRRYKHFDWLHERLVDKFCLIPIPPLPDKQISGRYEEQFVEHRRVQLQEFVDWVCRHPVLSKCEVWYHFLTCTDEKVWKLGKRKAERDTYVGITYCWAISPPEKQLLQSFVDSQMDSCSHFIHMMDVSVRNLLAISNDMAKKCQSQSKKEFQRIGDGFSDLSKSLAIDERRVPSGNKSLADSVSKVGDIFCTIGQHFGDQPKLDWIPFSDRLHIYSSVCSMLF